MRTFGENTIFPVLFAFATSFTSSLLHRSFVGTEVFRLLIDQLSINIILLVLEPMSNDVSRIPWIFPSPHYHFHHEQLLHDLSASSGFVYWTFNCFSIFRFSDFNPSRGAIGKRYDQGNCYPVGSSIVQVRLSLKITKRQRIISDHTFWIWLKKLINFTRS
jgi:hypothetical protein